jgi:glycosyltransferase involved in cell wall biosynthesis
MKILCMTYEYPPIGGGGASVAHPLAVNLAANGHEIDVVTSGMPDIPKTQTVDGIDVHRVRCLRRHRHYTNTPELLTYLWPAYSKAYALWKQNRYDINHTHFALPSGLASYMLYKKTGLPYVTTIHGSDVPGYNPDRFRLAHMLIRPVWKRVILNSARVVSASVFLKELIQQHLDVPVDVIPNGFEPIPDLGGSPVKKNRILVVTRMFQRKGVQHFVDALTGLDHDWEVVVAGDGPYLPALKEQALRNGVNIGFVGFVQGAELARLYESSKIFVFPSIQENFPTVLLEAMQAGCAIITTSAEGCSEVIGNAGIVTTPEKPHDIREALVSLMNDDNKITSYGAAARNRINLFRWPRIAAKYDDVLLDVHSQLTCDSIEKSLVKIHE